MYKRRKTQKVSDTSPYKLNARPMTVDSTGKTVEGNRDRVRSKWKSIDDYPDRKTMNKYIKKMLDADGDWNHYFYYNNFKLMPKSRRINDNYVYKERHNKQSFQEAFNNKLIDIKINIVLGILNKEIFLQQEGTALGDNDATIFFFKTASDDKQRSVTFTAKEQRDLYKEDPRIHSHFKKSYNIKRTEPDNQPKNYTQNPDREFAINQVNAGRFFDQYADYLIIGADDYNYDKPFEKSKDPLKVAKMREWLSPHLVVQSLIEYKRGLPEHDSITNLRNKNVGYRQEGKNGKVFTVKNIIYPVFGNLNLDQQKRLYTGPDFKSYLKRINSDKFNTSVNDVWPDLEIKSNSMSFPDFTFRRRECPATESNDNTVVIRLDECNGFFDFLK